jgi:integrase
MTVKEIRKLQAPDETGVTQFYWDEDLPGFAVVCSGLTTHKSYMCKGPFGRGGRSKRRIIGRVDVMPLDEARHKAKEMLLGLSAGVDPRARQTGGATLRQAVDLYIRTRGASMRERSVVGFRTEIERHLASWLDRPLRSVTASMVEERYRSIAAEIAEQYRQAAADHAKLHLARAERAELYAPDAAVFHRAKWEAATNRQIYTGFATANRVMKNFGALWNFMARRADADFPQNPVAILEDQWYRVEPRTRHLSDGDFPAFYRAVTALPSAIGRDLVTLLLFTGMRRDEASALTWDEIDLPHRVIRIPAERTKSRRPLNLPMSDVVYSMLKARRALGKTAFVFPGPNAKGCIAEPRFFFGQIAKTSGILVSPHDLRRSFITVAESLDISMLALAAMLNHAVPGMTSNYVKMSVERLRAPVQKVADRLKELCGI